MVGEELGNGDGNIQNKSIDFNEQFFPDNPDWIEAQLLDAFESHELSAEEYEKMRDAQERRKRINHSAR